MKVISLNNMAVQEEQSTTRNKLFPLIRQHGILKFAWLAFGHILGKTIRVYWWREILLERSLAEPIPEIVPKIQVVIRQATENDLDKFKGIVSEKNYNRFRQRFKKGRICHIVLYGDKLIAYTWLSLREYETNRRVELKLNDNEAYSTDSYVLPEYRQKGLHSALLACQLVYCKNNNFKDIVTLVDDTNTISLKTCARDGYRPSRTLNLFKIFGLTFQRWQKYTGTR